MFHLGDRHNTVQNGAEAHAGQEAERVTNVADRVTSLGLDPIPGIIFRLCTTVTVPDFAGWVAVESHGRV